MAKKKSKVTVEELRLAVNDLKDLNPRGKEFLAAVAAVVVPFGKLDVVYRDRARVLLHALIEAELLGTLRNETEYASKHG